MQLRRPAGACCVLLATYAALSLLNDPGGSLGTDTGAKVATLDQMVEDGTASPRVGYWAERWDPDGDYHPLFDTRQNDAGEWINVTTLPMLEAARPTWALGGYRLSLIWPMLGAVVAALAARDIGRGLAGESAGWRAFWTVGLASPVTVYALDLWEHTLGAGLMLAGVAALVRVVEGRAPLVPAALAGAAFGTAATMRTESFVVTFVAVGAACLVAARDDLRRGVVTGALAVAGFAIPWSANAVLEAAVGGNSRGARAAGRVAEGPLHDVGLRVEEALVTWFGTGTGTIGASVLIGILVVVALVGAMAAARRGQDRMARLWLVGGALSYLLVAVNGLGFVPGALVASPVAVAAVFLPHIDRTRGYLLIVAAVATPLIWAFQIPGGAGPQWGGRYVLATTLLFTVLGAVALGEMGVVVRRAVIGVAAAVTVFGVAWLSVRSHDVADTFDELAAIDGDDVVISTNGFFLREGGTVYRGEHWLSIGRSGDLAGAIEVAQAAGARTVGVLDFGPETPPVDGEHLHTAVLDFLGADLSYHRFEVAAERRR